jgi:hypothetical protein
VKIVVPLVIWFSASAAQAQPPQAQTPSPDPPEPERWNLFFQATSIGQYHGAFPAAYSGPFSLHNVSERDVSLTTTLFFSLRLPQKHASGLRS